MSQAWQTTRRGVNRKETCMLEPLSQCQKVLRDTVIDRTEGTQLRRISKLWGIPMPTGWDEDSWRAGLASAALGPRGTMGNVFSFVDGIFSYAAVTFEVTIDPALPNRITATAGAGTFNGEHTGRWVRIATGEAAGLYRTQGPADVVADGGTRLELCPIATAQWDAGDFSGLSAPITVDVSMLAFTFREPTPGYGSYGPAGTAATLFIDLYVVASDVPPTYLQPDLQWLLYDAEVAAFTVGETITGAISGATASVSTAIDNGLTGALQIFNISAVPFQDNEQITGSAGGDAVVNGTIGDLLVAYDNEVGGGFAVGATVDGTAAADPMVAYVVGLQDDGVDGWLTLQYASGQPVLDNEDMEIGAVVRGTANGAARALERPVGQEHGGHLPINEFVFDDPLGATAGSGNLPPLFLVGSGVAPEAQLAVKKLLPAGFFVNIVRGSA